jgi:branched-chain amino acid transport system substrate-binding protein
MMIVAELPYEATDPTVDSQIIQLKDSGANVFFNVSAPKAAAQGIRKAAEIDWKPVHYLNNVGASVGSVLVPAGLEKAVGLITVAYLKDAVDSQWANDPAMKDFVAFMAKYLPDGKLSDSNNVYGYSVAQTLVQVLKQCGDDLTRANIMRQAANLKNLQLPLALPGIKINTSPTDFYPFESLQLQRFDGKQWVLYGSVIE